MQRGYVAHQDQRSQIGEVAGCDTKGARQDAAEDLPGHSAGHMQTHEQAKHCGLHSLRIF